MQLETLDAIYEGLTDGVYGLLAQFENLPLADGDRRLDPNRIAIVHGLRDESVLAGQPFGQHVEVLVLLTPAGPTTTTAASVNGSEFANGSTPIQIDIIHRGEGTVTERVMDATYIMRAVVLGLAAYFARRQQDRVVRQVVITTLSSLGYGLVQDTGTGAVCAVTGQVTALDKRALTVSNTSH